MTVLFKIKSWRDTHGQDLIEYALMAGFVAVAAGAIMPGVATNISAIFSKVASVMHPLSGTTSFGLGIKAYNTSRMGFSINPLELFTIWKGGKTGEREQFIRWLEAVQAELKSFLEIWTSIDGNLEVLDARDDDTVNAGLKTLKSNLAQQRPLFFYIEQFYRSVSTTANGRLRPNILDQLSSMLGTVLNARIGARKQVERLVRKGDRQVMSLNPENEDVKLETVRDIVEALQREIVTLDVFIETAKADPNLFR